MSQNGVIKKLDEFLEKGFIPIQGYDSQDVTPLPTMELLEDDVVFITQQVANRLGVRAATILQLNDANSSDPEDAVQVERIDPYVESDEWTIRFFNDQNYNLRNSLGSIDLNGTIQNLSIDLGWGYPKFKIKKSSEPFKSGDEFKFQTFRSSILEIYSPLSLRK